MNRFFSHRSRNRFKPLFTIATLLFIALLVLVALEKTMVTDFIKLPFSSEQKQAQVAAKAEVNGNETQQKVDERQKQQFLDNTAENITGSKTPETVTTQTSPLVTELTARQEGENIVVLTKLTPVDSGTCTLRITNGTNTYEQRARIIYQPEFSSCAGFSLTKTALSAGKWKITLDTSSGNLSGTKTIELEVK